MTDLSQSLAREMPLLGAKKGSQEIGAGDAYAQNPKEIESVRPSLTAMVFNIQYSRATFVLS